MESALSGPVFSRGGALAGGPAMGGCGGCACSRRRNRTWSAWAILSARLPWRSFLSHAAMVRRSDSDNGATSLPTCASTLDIRVRIILDPGAPLMAEGSNYAAFLTIEGLAQISYHPSGRFTGRTIVPEDQAGLPPLPSHLGAYSTRASCQMRCPL
jgi:hypothetical protein